MKAYFCYRHTLFLTMTLRKFILSILNLHLCSFNGCSLDVKYSVKIYYRGERLTFSKL